MKPAAEFRFNVSGFSYEPDTGRIMKDGRQRDYRAGDYRRVGFRNVEVLAHRLAWRLHFGIWPPQDTEIDHENLNKQDNVISNLRLATRIQNSANKPANKNSKSGERGVYFCPTWKKWKIAFRDGRMFNLTASHKISAILAARLIRRTLHGEFAYEGNKSA